MAAMDPITGDAGAAIYISRDGVLRGTKISDHASNLTTELAAIILALLWTEEEVIIHTDSLNAI